MIRDRQQNLQDLLVFALLIAIGVAGRWGQPVDLAGAAIYLASSASNYVNGHVLVVDGGWMGR